MVRKLASTLLLSTVLLAGVALQAQAAAPKTADEVIALNLEARGGAAKIHATKSARITGKMMMGPGMEAPFSIEWKRPQHFRMEFTVQGSTAVQAYDGENAWMVMPFLGKTTPEPMPEEAKKQIVDQADLVEGDLVDYAKKGSTAELIGTEDFDGSPAYRVRITKKSGDVDDHFIDTEAHLEVGVKSKRTFNGQEVSVTTRVSGYKEVAGLVVPFAIEARPDGAPAGQNITIEKYEFDVQLPDDRFTMPAAPAPAPAGQ